MKLFDLRIKEKKSIQDQKASKYKKKSEMWVFQVLKEVT
jgi:hypothetical protein